MTGLMISRIFTVRLIIPSGALHKVLPAAEATNYEINIFWAAFGFEQFDYIISSPLIRARTPVATSLKESLMRLCVMALSSCFPSQGMVSHEETLVAVGKHVTLGK